MRTADKDVKGLGRVIRGQVSASGGIVHGAGFWVVNNSPGVYNIYFLVPFRSTPNIKFTAVDSYTILGAVAAQLDQYHAEMLCHTGANTAFLFEATEGNQA